MNRIISFLGSFGVIIVVFTCLLFVVGYYGYEYFDSSKKDAITILSPNGGEEYGTDDIILITSSGGRRSDVGQIENSYFLVDSNGNERHITTTGNKYEWNILSTYGESIMPGKYKIKVSSSFRPCNSEECAQTIVDYSDKEFTIFQKNGVPIPGTLKGSIKFIKKNNDLKRSRLLINIRTNEVDKGRGLPYTLHNIAMKDFSNDGTFSMNLPPGTYWIEDDYKHEHDSEGLDKFITINAGEVTQLDYIVKY